jgi:ABC-type uncharacterized transport system ATPase subunit
VTTDRSGAIAAPLAVQMRGITKRFGDVVANDRVDFQVERGEVHALLGENGAGKTTLMRVLYGLSPPDEGTIEVDGKPRDIRSPKDAIAEGLGMVTQHFSLVGPMTVAENLMLGAQPGFRIDREAAKRRVADASQRYDIKVESEAVVNRLSVGQQQRVEILKALARDCRLLILDEPTAVLVPHEIDALFATIRRLCAGGLSIVFISHKLNEVMAISDRITVLARGRVAGTVPTGDTDERRLARMMVGDLSLDVTDARSSRPGPALLEASGLSLRTEDGTFALRNVSLSVRAGEIVGVAGVSGNGQTELTDALSGMRGLDSGSVAVGRRELTGPDPGRFVAAGVGRIPEDRQASIVGDFSVAYNLALEHLDSFRKGPRLDQDRLRTYADDLIGRFAIKARPDDRIQTLSGGNVQKVLLARVLAREPKVNIAAQPTRGLDVGATEFVRRQLIAQRDRGAAVVLISEDLDEILVLSDRIVVMYEGTIAGEMDRSGADADQLGLLMAGMREAV